MHRKPNTVRIIAGRWRRRLLPVPDVPGVRPTHDRVRETLFNWLMPYTEGASCLDLFAGTGALGFEALSRDAKRVSFIDNNIKVIQHLKTTAQTFGVPDEDIEIVQGSCPEQRLPLSFYPYDIVFIDPPFQDRRLPEIIAWLESNDYLSQSALIYVETERQAEALEILGWHCLKEGRTKRICYYLFQRGL